jgi:general secretion pathway protein F
MKKYKIKYLKNDREYTLICRLDNLDKATLPNNILSIKPISFSFDSFFKKRVDSKELNLLFYELNLMLESNITFNDALNILIKNKKDKNILEFLSLVKSAFSNSKPVEELLIDFKIDFMVIAFLKMCQDSGNIKLNINALSKLLIENSEIKKKFYKAISYPILLIVSFCFALVSIFYFVIPKFKIMFTQFESALPLATKILFFVQEVFENYLLFIVAFLLVLIFIISYFYKSNRSFEFLIHKLLITKIPLLRDIYKNMELYKLFFVLKIMLDSKYEFHKALQTSALLLKNKYVLDRITIIKNLLHNGKQISKSFETSALFDDIILNLINTGEVSNSLHTITNEIRKIYKDRFHDKVNRLISLIQPIFLVLIMSLILWIVLAIFVPIWDIGNMIKM